MADRAGFANRSPALARRAVTMLLACITLAGAAHIPAFDIDTTCSEFDRFVTYVNRARAGSPDYG